MSEGSQVAPATAWPHVLSPDTVAALAAKDKRAPQLFVDEIVKDAQFVRRMAWARLACAMLLMMGSMGLSAYFLSTGSILGSGIAIGAGTLTVVTILLTGRPPALRRK